MHPVTIHAQCPTPNLRWNTKQGTHPNIQTWPSRIAAKDGPGSRRQEGDPQDVTWYVRGCGCMLPLTMVLGLSE